MELNEFIQRHNFGNKAAFAKANGVKPQQVTQWVKKRFIVVGGTLYSPRRQVTSEDPLGTGMAATDKSYYHEC